MRRPSVETLGRPLASCREVRSSRLACGVSLPERWVRLIDQSGIRNDPLTIERPKCIPHRLLSRSVLSSRQGPIGWVCARPSGSSTILPTCLSPAARLADADEIEPGLLAGSFSPTSRFQRVLQRLGVWRDNPGPAGHHAGPVVEEQVLQRRIARPIRRSRRAGTARANRSSASTQPPSSRPISASAANLSVAVAFRKAAEPHPSRRILVRVASRRAGHDDAHRLLHALENAAGDRRLMALRRTIDDPDLVGVAAQVGAHLLEARSVEEAGDADEADDPCAGSSRRLGLVRPPR